MDQRWGADPQQLRAVAQRIDAEREELEATFRGLSLRLESTWWQGRDADGFRDRWRQQHEARLRMLVSELRATTEQLRMQALRQERASST